MTKQYDRAYFDRWYRGRDRVHSREEVRRKIVLAVATAEYFLRRRIETVLDIGAGEGAWFTHLRSIRRGVKYQGIEPSEYAVRRFGASRNIRRGSFAGLAGLRLRRHFDLVVCSDVLHYLSQREIRAGLPELARLNGGVAFIEVFTAEDNIVGDLDALTTRPASWYRRRFERAGLTWVGPYCWLSAARRDDAAALEAAPVRP